MARRRKSSAAGQGLLADMRSANPATEVFAALTDAERVQLGTPLQKILDRRAELRTAAARVRSSLAPEFRQLGADEIMEFLRGNDGAIEHEHPQYENADAPADSPGRDSS